MAEEEEARSEEAATPPSSHRTPLSPLDGFLSPLSPLRPQPYGASNVAAEASPLPGSLFFFPSKQAAPAIDHGSEAAHIEKNDASYMSPGCMF